MKRGMFLLLPIFAMMSANTPLPEGINSNLRYLPTGFKSDIPRTNANFDSYKGSKRQKSQSSRANRRKVGGKSLHKLSSQFIEKFVEEFNKGNAINNVLVDYEEYFRENEEVYVHSSGAKGNYSTHDYKLKVDKKNTITIKRLKDSWNREEVEELVNKAFIAGYERSHSGYPNTDNHTKPKVEEFILNNL